MAIHMSDASLRAAQARGLGAVMQEPPTLRAIIAASAAATLLYTPVLKRLTFVKNMAVASVIALTPLTGALALGQVRLVWASRFANTCRCSSNMS